MKILALITARGGSKRLPGKNLRSLGGMPLVVWSINAAKDNIDICDILVSTDDRKIAAVCKKAGALVPWLRPSELATDTSSSVDAALHSLDWYEEEKGSIDGLLLLQPTSPYRTRSTVQRGIELYKQYGCQSVLGVSPAHSHPMWTLKTCGDHLVPFMEKREFGLRSQDLTPVYVVNGSFYLIKPSELREHRSFVNDKAIPLFITSEKESLDIDTEWDWLIAEKLVDVT